MSVISANWVSQDTISHKCCSPKTVNWTVCPRATHRKGSINTCLRLYKNHWTKGFPSSTSGKEPSCQCRRRRRQVLCMDWQDPQQEEMASHSSVLTWRIPWTEGPGGLPSIGSQLLKWLSIHRIKELGGKKKNWNSSSLLLDWINNPQVLKSEWFNFLFYFLSFFFL